MTYIARLQCTFLCLIVAMLSSACGLKGKVPHTNVVMAHSRGWAVRPEPGFPRLTATEYDAHIDAISADMQAFCGRMRAEKPQEPCQILFFVHGGMNTRLGSLERAIHLHKRIKDAGVYPVFLNWHSSFPSSWWDHLAKVRKGLWADRNIVFSPVVFASDQIRSIPEAPAAWLAEGRHAATKIGPANPAVRAYRALVAQPDGLMLNDLTNGHGGITDDRASWWERHRSWFTLPLTAPTKLVSAPFIIQPWGTGAWNVMLRRTDMLFRTEDAFNGQHAGDAAGAAGGGRTGAAFAHFVTRFQSEVMPRLCGASAEAAPHVDDMRQLNTRVGPDDKPVNCGDRVRLSLVGHSMGAIVVNEILRHVPDLEVANVVYMAAAASVRDYRDTVQPYLRAHPASQMFHLVLHPQAEVKERGPADLSPRGSLLVWIDNYFSTPVSPLDRTAGRFFNIAKELQFTDADVRPRVHFKVFRVGKRVSCWNPQEHSEFGDFPYWDRSFWDPTQDSVEGAPARWTDRTCDGRQPMAVPPQ